METEIVEETNAVTTISKAGVKYSERLIDQLLLIKEVPAVNQTLSDLGLKPYIKDVNKEVVKNVILAYGTFSLVNKMRSNILKIGIVGLTAWLFMENKGKIQTAIASITGEIQDSQTPQLDTMLDVQTQSLG